MKQPETFLQRVSVRQILFVTGVAMASAVSFGSDIVHAQHDTHFTAEQRSSYEMEDVVGASAFSTAAIGCLIVTLAARDVQARDEWPNETSTATNDPPTIPSFNLNDCA